MPTSLIGALLILVFVTPGYMWVRVEERHRLRTDRSPILEVAELFATGGLATATVGLLATIGAFVLSVRGVSHRLLLDVQALAAAQDPSGYLQTNLVAAIVMLGTIVVLAHLGAWGAARLWYPDRNRGRLHPASTPWYDVFGTIDTDAHAALLTVEQHNGTMLTGLMRSYPVAAADERVIALQRPIHRQVAGREIQLLDVDFVLLPGESIRAVYVAARPVSATK